MMIWCWLSTEHSQTTKRSFRHRCLPFLCLHRASNNQGLNWRVTSDLRSGTSCLRSTTSNNRSRTPQLRSGTFFAGIHRSAQFMFEYFFLYACCFVKNAVLRGHFVVHLSMLGVVRCCKRQTLFKCHKSQTECLKCMLENPWSAVREPHLCCQPFELELRPFKPRAYRDPPPLAE